MQVDVLGLGTVAVDDLLHVAEYPPADGKTAVVRAERHPGGQIATALAAVTRLGGSAAYLGILGTDDLSLRLTSALHTCGIRTDAVVVQPEARPIHSVIIVDETQHSRTIFFDRNGVRPFPPAALTADLLRGAGALLIDQLGMEQAIRAATLARTLGIPVVGDFEWPAEPRLDELMAVTDHLLLPRDVACTVTGAGDAAACVRELHRRAPRLCTAVTCGAEGCFYLAAGDAPEGVRHQPAFRVTPVSTTGCGDVFHGAYALAAARGQDTATALRFAAAAAAVYAARPNGWEHLATTEEVKAIGQPTGGRGTDAESGKPEIRKKLRREQTPARRGKFC
jgi:sugar/nucleoside kinase (ribokinase family)